MAHRRKMESQVSLDMRENDSGRLLTFLNCTKCHELAFDAVETICCRKLLCANCLEQLDRVCPKCKETCSHTPSHLARRLIGMQPWCCSECGKETTRSEQTDHVLLCPQRVRSCPAPRCKFTGLPDTFIDHLIETHGEMLLSQVDRLFKPVPRRVRRPLDSSSESSEATQSDISFTRRRVVRRRRIDTTSSREQSRVRIEVTGKNYCEGPLNGPPCECCDGRCGPGNGCNCVDCMRRDLVTFNINRPLTLVNREGVVARISRESGLFYCGRAVMGYDPRTDEYCGPNNGNNCHACHKLDQQIHGRYAAIAEQWSLEEPGVRDLIDLTEGIDDDDDDESDEPIWMGLDVID